MIEHNIYKEFVQLTSFRQFNMLQVGLLSTIKELVASDAIYLYQLQHDDTDAHWLLQHPDTDTAIQTDHLETLSLFSDQLLRGKPFCWNTITRPTCSFLPVHREAALIAVIGIECEPMTQITQDQVRALLCIYANQLFWLERCSLDPLTQLFNRHVFAERTAELLLCNDPTKTQRKNDSLAQGDYYLAIIDIDHFKDVNDNYGHLFGDEVLVHLANLMRDFFRANDWLFRFGGEEFVVVVGNLTETDAVKLFSRFCHKVADKHFPQLGQLTVSLGFTHFNRTVPAQVAIGHADQALYYVKDNGRNNSACFEALVAQNKLKSIENYGDVDLF